jgi:hypothetical protein
MDIQLPYKMNEDIRKLYVGTFFELEDADGKKQVVEVIGYGGNVFAVLCPEKPILFDDLGSDITESVCKVYHVEAKFFVLGKKYWIVTNKCIKKIIKKSCSKC